ncbi:alpha-galactosidase [Pontixanthobacter aestiaquae]|uniref:alpha-galactosidase n=1 Tax=Pontixanthobacter aestiaquae TaxID=1509367 RepID=UPI0025B515E6|nr:alpha-galactosidase [Pontixanthobacter aestiaquae]MDN3644726.1 alpha-galactosidase [Pontixanthobacter aestiaquae]
MTEFTILRGRDTLVVLGTTEGARPSIIYAGPDIAGATPEELALLQSGQHIPGGPEQPIGPSLLNPLGTGWPGAAGVIADRDGKDWAIDLRVESVRQPSNNDAEIRCVDALNDLQSTHSFALCPRTGVFTASTEIAGSNNKPVNIDWCAAICLPMDDRLDRLRSFIGKWASEFQIEDIERFRGSYLRENKAGRTSHSDFPGLFAGNETTDETNGLAFACHLGWSGNSRLHIDTGQNGQAILQAGELLLPGEVSDRYISPQLIACWSNHGYGDVSRRLHAFVKNSIISERTKPRPVHYNTWEAVYFDHDEARLIELAKQAAEVGAERFVLDDGWFGGRRSDKAGLGDWWVSPDVYPNGLHPIANRVRELGMEFGLWFEPEMVNPDSDLYRAHPDWVLGIDGVEPIPSRHQLTLDLTKPDVTDYLFAKISALIDEYQIDYIKWDMNRDTQHPASDGRAVMHKQTEALYALLGRFRTAHPALEIESCSSGGARADYEILRRNDRIWTSDNNDARHRHQIMRGASHFFPLSVLGNHVGPKRCHITGRMFSMEFRAASAIFGHMGMELDLADETAQDRATLAAAIALHKQHRELIHGGDFYRIETPDYLAAMGCVAREKHEALFSCALLDMHPATKPDRLRFDGLNPAKQYRIKLLWPQSNPSRSHPSIIDAAALMENGTAFAGAALMEHGIQLPLVHPDTCLIYHLEAEN